MDTVIPFDDVAECLRDPPTVLPRPSFASLRALRQHMIRALKLFECPQSNTQGWSGLVMSPTVYSLLEATPFMIPIDPGPSATYTPFAPPATIKMIDATFERDKNYFLSYKNIYRACFRMLDDLVPPSFKVSNVPSLLGWNTTMSIELIMSQMEGSYGKPSPAMLYSNDSLFKSPIAATDSPEALFYRMEQCQEIMTLGNLPYTTEQVIANAVRVLMASKQFPTRDFETWDATTPKTYPALKTFFHEAYNRRLNAIDLQNTTGTLGYAPAHNMYNVLDFGNDDDSTAAGSVTTTVPPPGVGTEAVSSIGAGRSTATHNMHPGLIAAITQSIAPAFNQVVQNQTALQMQIAAMSVAPPLAQAHPVQQVAFPMQQPFHPIAPQYQGYGRGTYQHGGRGAQSYQGGRGYQGGRQGRGGGRGRGRQRRPTFATMSSHEATGFYGPHGLFAPPNFGGGPGPFAQLTGAQMGTTPSPVKRFANWNACFSCGFDIEDGHTSATCPLMWRKPNHQTNYTRENASSFAAYGPCTKGQHKTQFPQKQMFGGGPSHM